MCDDDRSLRTTKLYREKNRKTDEGQERQCMNLPAIMIVYNIMVGIVRNIEYYLVFVTQDLFDVQLKIIA